MSPEIRASLQELVEYHQERANEIVNQIPMLLNTVATIELALRVNPDFAKALFHTVQAAMYRGDLANEDGNAAQAREHYTTALTKTTLALQNQGCSNELREEINNVRKLILEKLFLIDEIRLEQIPMALNGLDNLIRGQQQRLEENDPLAPNSVVPRAA